MKYVQTTAISQYSHCCSRDNCLNRRLATFWRLPSTPHYYWSSLITSSPSGRSAGGAPLEQNQKCTMGGQATPSRNVPAVLKLGSAFHTNCFEWQALQSICSVSALYCWRYCGHLLHELLSCSRKHLLSVVWQMSAQVFPAPLLELSIARHIITQSVGTRTNITEQLNDASSFIRQWAIWCYLVCCPIGCLK